MRNEHGLKVAKNLETPTAAHWTDGAWDPLGHRHVKQAQLLCEQF